MSSRSFAPVFVILTLAATLGSAEAQRGGSRPEPDDSSAVPQPTQAKQFPIGAAWTLVSIGGRAVGGERPSLTLDDQLRVKGFAGCNSYSATAYPLREQGFVVGPLAATRRACPQPVMAAERSFLTALRAARKWDVQEGRLLLTGGAGELRFERAL